MIEEFIRALARINTLKQSQRWQEAGRALDDEFQRLVGAGPQVVAQLSETELLAKLVQGEPTQFVHDKAFLLTALLKEAGDLATTQERADEARECYLKGLHLLLDTLARGEAGECPEFVPKVEVFVTALEDSPLPLRTLALLMQHYEHTGQFARAEDALHAMLDQDPGNSGIAEFGIAFYERLGSQSDSALAAGNLPRIELEAGLMEIRDRKGTSP
jgi:tetratricopeptide (TPR) repeat protein